MAVRVLPGNCLEVMIEMAQAGEQVDAIITDPPYHLQSIVKRFGNPDSAPTKGKDAYKRLAAGFMGKKWDGGDVAFNSVTWGTAARLLKPGGHLLACGGTRTWWRLGWAIEGGGLEIRDTILSLVAADDAVARFLALLSAEQVEAFFKCIEISRFGGVLAWVYGQGFPKSHNLDGEWDGWGTALKPAWEPIIVARKPLNGTIAGNVLQHGTGALNIDGCRIPINGSRRSMTGGMGRKASPVFGSFARTEIEEVETEQGRWPANVCHDGSDEVEAAFAGFGRKSAGTAVMQNRDGGVHNKIYGEYKKPPGADVTFGDSGTASRFFYTAKADKEDRWGSKHPTVKPIDLMRWLVRLVTPPGGTVLDPFAGSGTTAIACMAEGFDCILIEREPEYLADIEARLAWYRGEGRHRLAEKGRHVEPQKAAGHDLPLFGGDAA